MQRRSVLQLLLVFLIMAPLLTGCWDRMEIEERALVLGIGIDTVKEAEVEPNEQFSHPAGKKPDITKTGTIKISVQIAVPGRIPLGAGESGGGGGGKRTIWIVDAVGYTIADAFNLLQQRISRPLFLGHLRIIVVSEAVARRGIDNLNDYFRRNPEVRRTNWMVISKGEASDIIHASPQLDRVPSLYFVAAMDQAVKMGRFPNDFLGVFWSAVSAKGREGYLPYIQLLETDNIQIDGLALFRNNKMVAATGSKQITFYMGITGVRQGGGEGIIKPKDSEGTFMFQSRSRKSEYKISIRNGHPYIRVNVTIEGNLLSKSTTQVNLKSEVIVALQKQIEKQSMQGCKEFIAYTQKEGSDIFGFGEYIRGRLPDYWNKYIRSSERWAEQYPELQVDVVIDVHIRRIGMEAV